jgi:1,4-alpha-glucan branching enzyme
MGEEWGAREPFPWFCDFEPQLQAQVRAAREREFPGSPDPGAPATFASARLDWTKRRGEGQARILLHYRRLLAIRRRDIAPLLPQLHSATCRSSAQDVVAVDWHAPQQVLHLIANLSVSPAPLSVPAAGRVLFATHPGVRASLARKELPPWSVLWLLEHRDEA